MSTNIDAIYVVGRSARWWNQRSVIN